MKQLNLYSVEVVFPDDSHEILHLIGFSLADALSSNGIPADHAILHICKPLGDTVKGFKLHR